MRNLVANCSMNDCPLYCYEKEDSSWKLFCVLCDMYKHMCCVCMCKCIVFVVCRMCVIEAGRGEGGSCLCSDVHGSTDGRAEVIKCGKDVLKWSPELGKILCEGGNSQFTLRFRSCKQMLL